MVKTVLQLTKVRLLEMGNSLVLKFNKKNSANEQSTGASKIVLIILAVFLMLMVSFSFFTIFITLALVTNEYQCNELFFIVAGIASIGFSLLGSVLASQAYLFEAKDNELLISMPIPPLAILISRVISLYILNLIYGLIIALPANISYGLICGYSITGFIFNFFITLLIPMFATALCCVLGWILWMITSKIPFKNLVNFLLSIIVIASIMLLSAFGEPVIESIIENIDQSISFIKTFFPPLYWYSNAICNDDVISFVLLTVLCVVSIVLVFVVISKFYIKIISTKATVKKKKYIAKPMEQSSVLVALLKKEFATIISKPMYLLNCGMGTIFAFIFGIILLIKGNETSELIAQEPFITNIIGFVIVLALSMMNVLNEVSAPSISLESKTLWILKTMPVDYMDIFMAKALMSPVISIPGIIFMTVCITIVFPVTVTVIDIIFMIILPIMCAMLSGLLGVFINLKFPRFDYTSEIAVVKQSLSVVLTMLVSIFVAFIPFSIAFFIALFSQGSAMLLPYGVCTIYFAIVLTVLYVLLKTNGRKTFEKL